MPRLLRQIQKKRLRLSAKQNTEPYLFLINLLGFKPKRIAPYLLALRHKSVDGKGNERLEFLGDAVISLVVGDFLYQQFPKASEGQLTSYRARLVCRERLNEVARHIKLHQHLNKGIPLHTNAEDVYGNSLEALVGAIYSADGFQQAKNFINQYILGKPALQLCMPNRDTDFKSKLLQWGQQHHQNVSFDLLKEAYDTTKDQHTFVYGVTINNQMVSQGVGHTKKEAQQHAAKSIMQNRQILNSL